MCAIVMPYVVMDAFFKLKQLIQLKVRIIQPHCSDMQIVEEYKGCVLT